MKVRRGSSGPRRLGLERQTWETLCVQNKWQCENMRLLCSYGMTGRALCVSASWISIFADVRLTHEDLKWVEGKSYLSWESGTNRNKTPVERPRWGWLSSLVWLIAILFLPANLELRAANLLTSLHSGAVASHTSPVPPWGARAPSVGIDKTRHFVVVSELY